MEKNILRVFGNLAAIQMKHSLSQLDPYNKLGFVMMLLSHGYCAFEAPVGDERQVSRLKEIAKDCKAAGLEVEESTGEMKDGSWSHSGSNYISCVKLKINLPVSPAIKVLYAKSNKG